MRRAPAGIDSSDVKTSPVLTRCRAWRTLVSFSLDPKEAAMDESDLVPSSAAGVAAAALVAHRSGAIAR
jgi:hypothetical protein